MPALRLAVLLMAVTLLACDDTGTNATTQSVDQPLLISPNPLEVRVGEIAVLRVDGLAFDEAPLWTSENPAIATVSAGGFVRGVFRGTTKVTASVGFRRGEATVMVGGRPPVQ